MLIYNIGSGILRAVGDSVRPLIFLVSTSVLNIALDLIFVLVFHWQIAGVAFATVLSQLVSAFLVMYLLSHTTDVYYFSWRDLAIDRHFFTVILKIGLPAGIQSSITAFSNIFVQSYINFFGSVVMAGWTAYSKINSFSILPMSSIAMASTAFVSQNKGAQEGKRVEKGVFVSLAIALIATGVTNTLVYIAARQVVSIFSGDIDVINAGVTFVRVNTYFLLFNSVSHVLTGALRGSGRAVVPMVIMLFSFVVVRQIYLFVMTHFIVNEPIEVGLCYPVGWALCSMLELLYFLLHRKNLLK